MHYRLLGTPDFQGSRFAANLEVVKRQDLRRVSRNLTRAGRREIDRILAGSVLVAGPSPEGL